MAKKLPKVTATPQVKPTRETLPPAVGSTGRGRGDGTALQLVIPEVTLRDLKVRAASDGTTVRAIVLDALKRVGVNVPPGEAVDRRKIGRNA